ncbi:MAG TPA: winged helix-turn-helix domain-containing protein [Candidatus Limnocylindrales bacterium]|nr:winged helix-turn-helix domain-containing protein [Candidatus Limnocylindrales bacterium]
MTLLRLGPAALSRCRFAVSPLAETLGSLVALRRSRPEPWVAAWRARHRPAFTRWLRGDGFAAGLVSLVASTKWLPDVVTPPPSGGVQTRLADELSEVAAFADEDVRSSMGEAAAASWEPRDLSWLEVAGLAGRVAEVFQTGWERFVAPDWGRRRAVLERDIMHRAGVLAAFGWREAVSGMTRRSVWVGDDAIRFSDQEFADRFIADDGLIFVPYTVGGGWWMCERADRFALVYPARGAAVEASPRRDGLAVLLGAGRARVVRELARPATSSQLAVVLGVSLGTVSAHLGVLRESGVVSGARAGRGVVYRLTERGEALLSLLS